MPIPGRYNPISSILVRIGEIIVVYYNKISTSVKYTKTQNM